MYMRALQCVRCGKEFGPEVLYVCPGCGIEGILDVLYDYDRVTGFTLQALDQRQHDLWRYRELLPIEESTETPRLKVGFTPIYETPRLAAELGLARAYLKDDGRNPTNSLKDRASAVGVAKATELGMETIACASTGNAACSLAGFAAAAGLQCVIFVPQRAPRPKVAQLSAYGARVFRVQGPYEEAFEVCWEACERWGWYNRSCGINPYLVEGKKTAGLELAEQLGEELPDWVVVSVGDGCTISGVWKGLWEMHRLGLAPRVPKLLGVQAEGAQPIVQAFERDEEVKPTEAQTVADSISVGHPRNWRKALRAVRESKGQLLAVRDEEILDAITLAARKGAVFAEPAAAASLAGLARARREELVRPDQSALVLITGNGLKDIESALKVAGEPIDIEPSLSAVEAALRADGAAE